MCDGNYAFINPLMVNFNSLTTIGGKERTIKEFIKLLNLSGFELVDG
ncbi:MAG: hypothetical protein GF311_10190 [Candidatus Lokiarchaeota archaeon]|nr:hypothetical protein [Candidatus Lokiarchaeota archaeon]